MLQGVRAEELSGCPARRVAGIDAAGVRLRPAESATSIAQVDIWADPETGLPLRVELYGVGDRRPVLTQHPAGDRPDATARVGHAVPPGVGDPDQLRGVGRRRRRGQRALPVRPAGHASPASAPAAGRTRARSASTAAGPTTLIVLPLRGQVARPLRERLRDSGERAGDRVGTLAPVGPIGLLLTPRRVARGALLLTGTVTAETLQRAATELLAG